jgi:hypothetical protein
MLDGQLKTCGPKAINSTDKNICDCGSARENREMA